MSELQILPVQVIECIELGSSFPLRSHTLNLVSVGECDLSLHGTVCLVAWVFVCDVTLVIRVHVLHQPIVIGAIGDLLHHLRSCVPTNYGDCYVVSVIVEDKAPCEISPGCRHF